MKEFVGLRGKTCSYLEENNNENKRVKDTNKCAIKRELKFQDYKNYLNAAKIDGKFNYLEKNRFNVDKLKEFVKNKTILKTQPRFKSEMHNVFTEVINKIALSTNDDKIIQSVHAIETYAYGTSEDIIHVKEKIKRCNIVTEMFNFDYISKENIKEHNPEQPETPDHPYQILINGGSGSRKTNPLLNLINNKPDIDKIYLYAKDPYEAKYQLLINKRENTGLKYFNDSKAFLQYSNDMDDIYENIEE